MVISKYSEDMVNYLLYHKSQIIHRVLSPMLFTIAPRCSTNHRKRRKHDGTIDIHRCEYNVAQPISHQNIFDIVYILLARKLPCKRAIRSATGFLTTAARGEQQPRAQSAACVPLGTSISPCWRGRCV